MGRLAKALIAVGALVALAAGGLVLFAGQLARTNKDRLVAAATAALRREVAVAKIGASLWGGLALTLGGIRVADDPAFSSEPLLAVETAALRVRLLPLLRREIVVRRLVLRQPQLTVVRDIEGRLNVAALGAPSDPGRGASASVPPAGAGGAAAILASAITIHDGALAFVDHSRPGGAIRATGISADGRDISGDGSEGTLAVRIAAVSGLPVPVADVTADLQLVPGGLEARAMRARVGREELSGMAAITAFAPLRARYTLSAERLDLGALLAAGGTPGGKQGITGRDRLTLEEVRAEGEVRSGAAGAPPRKGAGEETLSVSAKASAARGTFGDLDATALAVTAVWQPLRTTIDALGLAAYGGSLAASGEIETPATGSLRLVVDSEIRDVDVARAFTAVGGGQGASLRGRLGATLGARGAGAQAEELARSLRGQGTVEIRDGALLGTNIVDGVLRGVTGLPGLSTLLSERTRGKFPEPFGTEQTTFNALRSRVALDAGVIRLTDLVIAAPDYEVTGAGSVTFERKTAITATLTLGTRLSAGLITEQPAARVLEDPEGCIAIPFVLTGVPPMLVARPDLTALAKRAVGGTVTDAIGSTLQRLLPGRGRASDSGARRRRSR